MPEPSCRVDANFSSDRIGAAACLVVLNNKLLVTQSEVATYNLAISPAINNNAQCNAHNAMWEHTGLNVEVGQVLAIQNDGTWLFSCELQAGFDGTEEAFEAPEWRPEHVTKLAFVDPFLLRIENWYVSEHFITTRDAYVLEVARQNNVRE